MTEHNHAYPYIWRWKAMLPERFGQACTVTARGRMNTIRVDFPDGSYVFTSRWAVRLRTVLNEV